MRVALALVFTCISGLAAAQDTLEPVRELYASADYEGALSALGRLQAEAGSLPRMEIDRYRVFCLMALGRSAEANQVIEGIVAEDPLYHPSSTDAPPRIRAVFTQVRRRVLPPLVRRLYTEGKAERREHAAAHLSEDGANTRRGIGGAGVIERIQRRSLR